MMRTAFDGVNGSGTLLSVTFKAIAGGETQLKLNKFQFGAGTGGVISAGPHEVTISIEGQLANGDVNRDGVVSILDMILIARQLGETSPSDPAVDVNGDGVVNVLDLAEDRCRKTLRGIHRGCAFSQSFKKRWISKLVDASDFLLRVKGLRSSMGSDHTRCLVLLIEREIRMSRQ